MECLLQVYASLLREQSDHLTRQGYAQLCQPYADLPQALHAHFDEAFYIANKKMAPQRFSVSTLARTKSPLAMSLFFRFHLLYDPDQQTLHLPVLQVRAGKAHRRLVIPAGGSLPKADDLAGAMARLHIRLRAERMVRSPVTRRSSHSL